MIVNESKIKELMDLKLLDYAIDELTEGFKADSQRIEDRLHSNNEKLFPKLESAVHRLKGRLRMLGIARLTAILQEMEYGANSHNITLAKEKWDEFKQHYHHDMTVFLDAVSECKLKQ